MSIINFTKELKTKKWIYNHANSDNNNNVCLKKLKLKVTIKHEKEPTTKRKRNIYLHSKFSLNDFPCNQTRIKLSSSNNFKCKSLHKINLQQ